ncbi:MAG: glycoside hydrolase family 5 protein [Endomicrobia bacterium]|nr:glycoside hydrolase family 5 protein [Endomicrobiia bacterium]MCL2506232.1 glycoside hydrolase family 5 protein [Endomicrobiia bacterium]
MNKENSLLEKNVFRKKNERFYGVNLGAWLMMEGYMTGGRNISEHVFKKEFSKVNGKKALKEFEKAYRDNFITELDFKNISKFGANTIRLPFNYSLIETAPYKYSEEGIGYLKKALDLSKKYGLKVILDLHAAPGAQNADWHSDSTGIAKFWDSDYNKDRACKLWAVLAKRFRKHEALLGYDVLNEPVVLEKKKKFQILDYYKKVIKAIRDVDEQHIIWLEGNLWSQDIDFLAPLIKPGIEISMHSYAPLDYVYNYTPTLKFPCNSNGEFWTKDKIKKHLKKYFDFAKKYNTNIFCGEFGINWRGGHYGEKEWLDAMLGSFKSFGFDYTLWSYKEYAGYLFPSGLYWCVKNTNYIKREGPVYGFETYINGWKKDKKEIIDLWRTDKSFIINKDYAKIVSGYFKK